VPLLAQLESLALLEALLPLLLEVFLVRLAVLLAQ
jgi:hypothetical protein